MTKNRAYGDRGTGYTERNEKKIGRGSRWCKICGCYTSYFGIYLNEIENNMDDA